VVDLRLLRRVCHQAAARTGGTVTGFRISDGVTPNFHQAILTYASRRVAVVCNRDAPILALALPRSLDLTTARDCGPLTFVDMPDLAAALTDAGTALEGLRVLTRADLDGPILPAEWPDISSDDLRYWSPASLGEALFNYWD
jgi:hypothetical protein